MCPREDLYPATCSVPKSLLPTPRRPWSHIAVDFVTGLPPSAGHTTILTLADHYSKAVHFILLSKLPSAE